MTHVWTIEQWKCGNVVGKFGWYSWQVFGASEFEARKFFADVVKDNRGLNLRMVPASKWTPKVMGVAAG